MKQLTYCIILTLLFLNCEKQQKYQLAPDIYILDKKQSIHSLEELKVHLNGKAFFIDRWATWCSPCVKEFSYNEELYQFLKENNIEMVYLNSDRDINKKSWFNFILKHKLKGYHLRLDSMLKSDLIKHEIFEPRIPQYILFNAKGELVTNNACRPSSKEELYRQIKAHVK